MVVLERLGENLGFKQVILGIKRLISTVSERYLFFKKIHSKLVTLQTSCKFVNMSLITCFIFLQWPSPQSYVKKPTLGPKQNTVIEAVAPKFQIGVRRKTNFILSGE